jgi:hypothetical protein
MARNRIIYQSEALYAGPSPASGNHFSGGNTGNNLVNQLQRIQSANYSFNIARQDVNQFGELAAIDRVILESPTVSLDFSYLLNSFGNEELLGFGPLDTDQTSCISGMLNKTSDERNYFIRTVSEGTDALGVGTGAAGQNVIGIGNGFITSYSTEGSVGNFPTVTVNVEALNMSFDAGVTGNHIPAVLPTDGSKITGVKYALDAVVSSAVTGASGVSALRPGDITVDISAYGGGGVSVSDAKIQSYTLSFDLARDPLQKLGSKFAFAREIQFPVTVSMSVQALLGDLTTGNLSDIITTDSNYDLSVALKHPTTSAIQAKYFLKRAKLDSQEFSSSIGDNKSVTLNFSTQIGGPSQTDRGLFMSGVKD